MTLTFDRNPETDGLAPDRVPAILRRGRMPGWPKLAAILVIGLITGLGSAYLAVDNAPDMVARCRQLIAEDNSRVPVDVIEGDIRGVEIESASVVLVYFTLQFLPLQARDELLRKIARGMTPGGVLILAVVLTYRICDAIWGTFAYPFYLGELDYTNDDVAFASKFFGVGAIIAGLALGALPAAAAAS